MGYFMKDYLLNFPKTAIFNQVATDSNSPCSKVALTSAVDCPVESK
jgi:hypothetical protein